VDSRGAAAPRILLASASERRRALLEACRIPFDVLVSDASEEVGPEAVSRGSEHVVSILAARKAETVRQRLIATRGLSPESQACWVLGADTVVEVDGLMLGKPADEAEARGMLERLAGRTHRVHTGLALIAGLSESADVRSVTTEVTFRPMTAADVDWYLSTREWLGAAGAYRIQERGAFLVEAVRGSYSNVVGLPLEAFYGMLVRHRYNFGAT
jgi:septum formation protein